MFSIRKSIAVGVFIACFSGSRVGTGRRYWSHCRYGSRCIRVPCFPAPKWIL